MLGVSRPHPTQDVLHLWKNAKFMKSALTELAHTPKLGEMIWFEKLCDDALPETSEVDQTFHAHQTYAQIGPDAAQKIINMFTENMAEELMGPGKCLVVLDMQPYSLDFARAVMSCPNFQNMVYVGFCDDENQKIWAEATLVAELTEHIKNEKLVVPGFTVPPVEVPSSMAMVEPPKPELNFLCWGKEKHTIGTASIPTLVVPDKYVNLYKTHPTYGAEFMQWYEEAKTSHYLDYKPGSDDSVKAKPIPGAGAFSPHVKKHEDPLHAYYNLQQSHTIAMFSPVSSACVFYLTLSSACVFYLTL